MHYADIMVESSKKTKYHPANTKAQNLRTDIVTMKIKQMEQNPLDPNSKQFKMKRFQKVGNKVNTNRLPPLFNRAAQEQEQPQQEPVGCEAPQELPQQA